MRPLTFILGLLALGGIAAAVTISVVGLQRERALRQVLVEQALAQRVAQSEVDRLEAEGAFYRTLLGAGEAGARGPVRMADLVRAAAIDLDAAPPADPLTEAALHAVLGEAFLALGEAVLAEPHLRVAHEIRVERLGAEHLETLEAAGARAHALVVIGLAESATPLLDVVTTSLSPAEVGWCVASRDRARIRAAAGQVDEARAELGEALTAAQAADADPIELARIEEDLAGLCEARGTLDEAIDLRRRALGRRENAGARRVAVLRAQDALAAVLDRSGRAAEAAELGEQVLAARRKLLGETHPDTLQSVFAAARRHARHGELERADALFAAGLAAEAARSQRQLRPTRQLRREHADVLARRGDPAAAAVQLREVLAAPGLEVLERAATTQRLAGLLGRLERDDEAVDAYRRALGAFSEHAGEGASETLLAQHELGVFLTARGRSREAEPLLRAATATARTALGDEHYLLGLLLQGYGQSLMALGRLPQAERALLESHALLERTMGSDGPSTRAVARDLVALYRAWGKPVRAAEYEALLRDD